MSVRNLDYIRQMDPRLYEAIADIIQQHQTLTQQVAGNSTGQPEPPPPISGLKVTGQNGHFHIQITDNNPIYRGIRYQAEYADNPNFTHAQPVRMGDARNHTVFLGNGTYYWRAYSAYISSHPSDPAYHGDAGLPLPVSGGGDIGGPALLPPQGTGTGSPGEALSGPGKIPFRSADGVPPKR